MALNLTPDDIKRLQEKELANAIRKLQEGKTLTNGERALIAQAGIGSTATAEGGFAGNWDDLAKRLGVTRRAVQEWRKDPRYAADCPPDRPDGRKEVSAWAAFMVRHALARADEKIGSIEGEDDAFEGITFPAGSESDWKKKLLEQKVAQAEVATGKLRGSLLESAELEIPLGTAFVAITNRVTQLAETLAPLVVAQMDVSDIIDIIRPETQSVLAALNAADYLADVDQLVGDLPTDPETTRLLQLVTFDGQDRDAFRQLIKHLLGVVLRGIGRRAIQSATCPQVTDSVTGQTLQTSENHAAEVADTDPKMPLEHPKAEPSTSKTRARKSPAAPVSKRRSSPKPKPKPRRKQ